MANRDERRLVSPRAVVEKIVAAIPSAYRENVILIGSLAAGYLYFANNEKILVRTKDVDCLIFPRIHAIGAGKAITEKLLHEGWRLREEGEHGKPGDAETPEEALPAVRLYPPESNEWFIELLTVPDPNADSGRHWTRIQTSFGDFGLCSFGVLRLTEYEPIKTNVGVYVARPEMMALANMLAHRSISPELMTGLVEDRAIKRSNKDLGRVLALVWLAQDQEEDALLSWADSWMEALTLLFPTEWRDMATTAGAGIRELLSSDQNLEEAWHTCAYGLLSFARPTIEQLRIAGERLIIDAVDTLAAEAQKLHSVD